MKAIKYTLIAITMVALTSVSSCSFFEGTAKHREKGTPIASTKPAVDKILANIEDNEDKRYSITGYLHFSASTSVYTSRPQYVEVYAQPGDRSAIATIEMHWRENGNNSVFVPQDGGRDETKTIFYDNEGKPFSMSDKVTISFSVSDQSPDLVETRLDRAI
jgi:hypothetical protein